MQSGMTFANDSMDTKSGKVPFILVWKENAPVTGRVSVCSDNSCTVIYSLTAVQLLLYQGSGFLNRELDLCCGSRQFTSVMLNVDLAIWTYDLVPIRIDPFQDGGMTLREIFEIALMDGPLPPVWMATHKP